MKKKKILWDADEVLIKTTPAFDAYLNQKFNLNLKYEDHITFDLTELLRMSEPEIKKEERLFYETDFYLNIEAKEGACEVIDYLSESYGHLIATGRSISDEKHLHLTLDRLFKPHHFSSVHHMGGEHGYSLKKQKWEKCREEGAGLVIDDYHKTVFNAANNGVYAILMTAPWNKGLTDLPKLVSRARNMYEAVDVIERKAKIIWPE